ncbi:AlpA family transcriptional regulator [Streptomyces sp. TLI_146]|uniref:helix-turn-helix transcriptional regulator n=1 Tax=Streptomyces sp. TLI_146 TaxID=1938858 RepID=UPI000C7022DB|nr:helix-turn-helix domain-containing protein [Streptomyces sp. TLI_146]PKV87895.1 helix-turn-helix protein [Streptomyces sp. TLI_146]
MARERTAELLTVRQVLDELGGISRRTFYRWRDLRIAPRCIRLPNGELRVRRDVLAAWLEELAEGAAS